MTSPISRSAPRSPVRDPASPSSRSSLGHFRCRPRRRRWRARRSAIGWRARRSTSNARGESVRLVIEAPVALMPYIAAKGSVALDGISLTVNDVADGNFGVNIIPYTLAHTSLGEARPGQRLNLEIDPLARYVARLLSAPSDKP